MLVIISPAKNLDFKSEVKTSLSSQPEFQSEAKKVVSVLKKIPADGLKELLNISDKLAELNYLRYQQWHLPFTVENARQAILAFNGEVFNGLQARRFTNAELEYAQDHLRILSGLHGVIRPLDLIQPYRLEMGIDLEVGSKKNLYEFWGTKIVTQLNEVVEQQASKTLINLASNEYSKAALLKKIKGRVITIEFKELKGDKLKTIVVYTKKARGMMTNFIIKNRIEEPEELKHFDHEGYSFTENLSSEEKWVFTR